MNKTTNHDGVLIHEYTKEHYNLYDLYATVAEGTPELVILEAWYNGEYGEATCVNKLEQLGLIQSDYFKETTFMPSRITSKVKNSGKGTWQTKWQKL